MIPNDSSGGIISITYIGVTLLFRHFDQRNIGNTISNFKSAKLKLGPVVRELAEESVSRFL